MSTHPKSSSTTQSSEWRQNDRRLLIVVFALGIALIGFIIYMTVRLKRRRPDEASGPYKGTLVHHEHPAAQITPFGGGGPYSGRNTPQFKYTPGEDMRIAFRRPDGAWHFADSRTPFTPTGVNDIDVLPSPLSSSASLFSFNTKMSSNKEQDVKATQDLYKGYDPESDFEITPIAPPPPAYHRESCHEHFDGNHSAV